MESFVAGNFKVLVVDDNIINREVIRDLLETYPVDVSEAESGPGAIELVKKTRFDMIFMDHMMPGMDGMEAVRIIRSECGENGSHPAIFALTAHDMDGDERERFLNSGFQKALTKPVERTQLDELFFEFHPGGFKAEVRVGPDKDSDELLRLYCMDGKRKVPLLKKLFDEKDYSTYEVEVHGLKSASANIGDMELSAAFREHEEAAAGGDTEFIAANFHKLLDAYEEQMDRIRKVLDEKQEDGEHAKEKLPPPDKKELAGEVREALNRLESFRSRECLEKIENLLRHDLPEEVAAKLTEVKEQLKLYEDELAEQLLHGLLEWIDEEDI